MYYVITGKDYGMKIEPYIQEGLDCINPYGDCVRYYEKFKTKSQAEARVRELQKEVTHD